MNEISLELMDLAGVLGECEDPLLGNEYTNLAGVSRPLALLPVCQCLARRRDAQPTVLTETQGQTVWPTGKNDSSGGSVKVLPRPLGRQVVTGCGWSL